MIIWLLPSIFACCYLLLGGIEFGLPLFLALDGGKQRNHQIAQWFSPAWEVTNVFLVMSLTTFMAVFPLAIPLLSDTLRNWLLISGVLLAIRAALVLTIFYGHMGPKLLRQLLAVISLLIPAVLAQVGLALILPGATVVAALSIAIGAISLALALSAGFFHWIAPDGQSRNLWLFGLAGLSVALAGLSRYDNLALVTFVSLVAISVALLLGWLTSHRRLPLISTVVCVIALVAGLLIRQWPDVVYGQVSYTQAATGAAVQQVILIGLVAGLILVIPALFGLFRILKRTLAG